MAYPFSITLNLNILSDCHIQAAISLAEAPLNADVERLQQHIELSGIQTQSQLEKLKNSLNKKLIEYNLVEHQDHFIYFYYLFLNFDAPDFLYNEMLYKHASDSVKRLTELVTFKNQTANKDLIISIKSKRNPLSVTFDAELTMSHVWEDLYNALIKSSISSSDNPILQELLGGKELTIDYLKEVAKELRIRKNSFWNKALADFSKTLLYYFKINNIYRGESELSSDQARLIFELLEAFHLLNSDKIISEKDDYIKALLRNNNIL